jgi:transcription elongation GreA/GreB family factor
VTASERKAKGGLLTLCVQAKIQANEDARRSGKQLDSDQEAAIRRKGEVEQTIKELEEIETQLEAIDAEVRAHAFPSPAQLERWKERERVERVLVVVVVVRVCKCVCVCVCRR